MRTAFPFTRRGEYSGGSLLSTYNLAAASTSAAGEGAGSAAIVSPLTSIALSAGPAGLSAVTVRMPSTTLARNVSRSRPIPLSGRDAEKEKLRCPCPTLHSPLAVRMPRGDTSTVKSAAEAPGTARRITVSFSSAAASLSPPDEGRCGNASAETGTWKGATMGVVTRMVSRPCAHCAVTVEVGSVSLYSRLNCAAGMLRLANHQQLLGGALA